MRGGKERSQKVRKVREQDGSDGWRVAQESEVISGCAPELTGEMGASEAGRMSSFRGKRVGEMKALGVVSVCIRDREYTVRGKLTASSTSPSARDYPQSRPDEATSTQPDTPPA